MHAIKELITHYYTYFNQKNMTQFFALLDENIIHDINQGERQIGKRAFEIFMNRMNACYEENVKNLVVMGNEDGTRAAAEFIIEGTYIQTDVGLPPASGQQYSLTCGAFFEISYNKIVRVTNYYNLNDWLKQIEQ